MFFLPLLLLLLFTKRSYHTPNPQLLKLRCRRLSFDVLSAERTRFRVRSRNAARGVDQWTPKPKTSEAPRSPKAQKSPTTTKRALRPSRQHTAQPSPPNPLSDPFRTSQILKKLEAVPGENFVPRLRAWAVRVLPLGVANEYGHSTPVS